MQFACGGGGNAYRFWFLIVLRRELFYYVCRPTCWIHNWFTPRTTIETVLERLIENRTLTAHSTRRSTKRVCLLASSSSCVACLCSARLGWMNGFVAVVKRERIEVGFGFVCWVWVCLCLLVMWLWFRSVLCCVSETVYPSSSLSTPLHSL